MTCIDMCICLSLLRDAPICSSTTCIICQMASRLGLKRFNELKAHLTHSNNHKPTSSFQVTFLSKSEPMIPHQTLRLLTTQIIGFMTFSPGDSPSLSMTRANMFTYIPLFTFFHNPLTHIIPHR